MKIEPNSDADLLHNYNTANIELLNLIQDPNGIEPNDYEVIVQGYHSLIRFLEKCIKERQLWN